MEDKNIVFRNLNRFKLLTDKILNNWDSYEFFLDYIIENFKNYLSLIPSFEGYVKKKLIENKDVTICLCEKIIQAISDYLKGRMIIAYDDMKDAFSGINDILKRKSSNRYEIPAEFGFKARIIESDKLVPSREAMFHIPFEMRHLVKDNRYSIHGVPSIYLGKSIYTCYIELGSPSLNNFWVSLFTFSDINLIDLTLSSGFYDIGILLDYVKEDEEKYIVRLDRLVDDILLWPLIMACAIPCKYSKATFKQEYIIPQILYELCSEEYNNYVGIKYLSTKIKYVNKNIYQRAMENYALPAHNVRRSGYCPKLASQLILTMPIAASQSQDIEIDIKESDSLCGLPILSNMHESLKNDETILSLDKMTIYFDRLVHSFMEERKTELLAPLNGWG